MANKVTDNVDALRRRAATAMETASDSARETAAIARERLASAYGSARGQADKLAGTLNGVTRETAADAINRGREQASGLIAQGKIKGSEALHKAGAQAQDYPLATLAGAVVAGLVIGLALPRITRDRAKSADQDADTSE